MTETGDLKVLMLAEHFGQAVREVARFAPKAHGLPILKNLLVGSEAGRVTVTATDLEIAVTAYVGAQVEADGQCLLPAVTLAKMLAKIKGDRVQLTGNVLDIDGRMLSLNSADPEDYPPLPDGQEEQGEVAAGELRQALQRALICVDTDSTRPVLTCINLAAGDGKMTLTATDATCLGSWRIAYTGEPIAAANVLAGAASALLRLLPKDDTPVTIALSGTSIRLSFGNYVVRGQLSALDFPNYQQVIPEVGQHTAAVTRKELLTEVQAAMAMGPDKDILRLTGGEGCLHVAAKASGAGRYAAQVPAKMSGPGDGKIAVNGKLLADLLGELEDGIVSINWDGVSRPMRITDGQDGLFILMPMHVEWPG
jgi:DNA polymerase-3 subunit beta